MLKKEKGRISLTHVGAHTGIIGNEKADKLAKEAREQNGVAERCDEVRIISSELFKKEIKNWIQRKWKEKATEDIWGPDPSIWRQIEKCKKIKAKRIIEVITGHGNFRYMLKKKGQTNLEVCRICKVALESAKHLRNDCIGTIQERALCKDKSLGSQIKLAIRLLEREDINTIMKKIDVVASR